MRKVDRDIDRIVSHLRDVIRISGYTQREIQDVFGWGRSYISQLLTQQKNLRFEQIQMILNVINVKPEDFWGEIYRFKERYRPGRPGGLGRPGRPRASSLPGGRERSALHSDLRGSRLLLDALVAVLMQKQLVTSHELENATRRFRSDTPGGHGGR